RRVAPDFQFTIISQRSNALPKSHDTLVVIFEDENGSSGGHVQHGMVVHGLVFGSESRNFSIANATSSVVSVSRIWSRYRFRRATFSNLKLQKRPINGLMKSFEPSV